MSLPEDLPPCPPDCDFEEPFEVTGGGDPYDWFGSGDIEPDPDDPYGDEGPGNDRDDDIPDYPDPEPDPAEPKPPGEPVPPDQPDMFELGAAAEASRLRALNSLNRAWAMLDRYLGGRISDFDRATVDASMALYFPGATRETIRTIRDTIGRASAFLAGVRFIGISTESDLLRITDPFLREAVSALRSIGHTPETAGRDPVWLWTDQPTSTIFVFPSFRTHFRFAADRASALTHEAFHGVPEPGVPRHETWRIDHGEDGGGALDNAYNYQGLVADLAGLPITETTHVEIDRFMSYPHPPPPPPP